MLLCRNMEDHPRLCLKIPVYLELCIAYPLKVILTLLHSERPKLYTILAFLSVKGLMIVL